MNPNTVIKVLLKNKELTSYYWALTQTEDDRVYLSLSGFGSRPEGVSCPRGTAQCQQHCLLQTGPSASLGPNLWLLCSYDLVAMNCASGNFWYSSDRWKVCGVASLLKVKGAQSCLALCILQARILERVAFPFSRGSPQPRVWTQVSHIAGRFFTNWAIREAVPSGLADLFLCLLKENSF